MKRPVIGIVCRVSDTEYLDKKLDLYYSFTEYVDMVVKYGGVPLLILPSRKLKNNENELEELSNFEKEILIDELKLCDGVIMPGGSKTFKHDYFIDSYLKDNNIPTLGICLGMQIMCRNNGNKLEKIENSNHDRTTHKVVLNGYLKELFNQNEIIVNSYHNSKVHDSNDYSICATSEDGIIEAIYDKNSRFRLGIQWHPEKDMNNEYNNMIITKFIEAALDNIKR